MKFLRQDAVNQAVLFKLFQLAQASDEMFPPGELMKQFKINIGAKRVKLAFEHLNDEQKISYYPQTSRASINREGYKYVEDELIQEGSWLALYAENGDEWLASQTLVAGDFPASDRVVSRTDNQAEIEEISGGLEKLVKEIKEDNELGAALGDDRELLIAEVNASQTLVRSEQFRLAKLASLLVPALRFLADRFSGAAIGELSKRLINLILGLF
jgi:hypothetical protein